MVDHEAEYESILVALDERDYVPEALATAIKLAARRRRGVHVLVTITVPPRARSTPSCPQQERAAQEIIEQAKLQGGRRVSGHYEKVRPGGEGRLIVRRGAGDAGARHRDAAAPQASGGGSALFGRTLETVLAERPCRVIIESVPADGDRARPGTARAGALA